MKKEDRGRRNECYGEKERHYKNGKNERVRREGVKREERERTEREQSDDCTGGRKKEE